MAEKEYIERKALGIGRCNPEVFENKAYADGWNSAIEIIESTPAADVTPVCHGHWIRVKGIIQCDICGFGLFPDGYFFENGECTHSNEQNYRLNFCPNCGAKMDKES